MHRHACVHTVQDMSLMQSHMIQAVKMLCNLVIPWSCVFGPRLSSEPRASGSAIPYKPEGLERYLRSHDM